MRLSTRFGPRAEVRSSDERRRELLRRPTAHEPPTLTTGSNQLRLAGPHGHARARRHRHQHALPRDRLLHLRPGLHLDASCKSKITFIDGDKGVLLYRGYPIDQLAEHGNFLETCYLLLYGELPTTPQYEEFDHRITRHTMVHEQMTRFYHRLPPRRASDGGHGRRGRRALGLLSRLDRHQGSGAARDRERSA